MPPRAPGRLWSCVLSAGQHRPASRSPSPSSSPPRGAGCVGPSALRSPSVEPHGGSLSAYLDGARLPRYFAAVSLGERLRSLALSARTHLTWSRLRWALATLVVAGIAWLICPRCMTEPTLLYVLSTLAQTCAALAAFVGAVGIFRLQTLRDQRAALEREAIGWAQATSGHYDFSRMPMELVQPSMAGLETAGTISSPWWKSWNSASAHDRR